jgi:U3 small nucleolar RNA-associated protein 19
MSKTIIPNFANPLIISDFLTDQLNNNEDIEMQVLALRTIFILLEKYGLDYPNYYSKLYDMIKPRIKQVKGSDTYEIVTIFKMPEKSRFLRLMDLSLRSPKLPVQMVASFLKRLCRIIVSYGEGTTT